MTSKIEKSQGAPLNEAFTGSSKEALSLLKTARAGAGSSLGGGTLHQSGVGGKIIKGIHELYTKTSGGGAHSIYGSSFGKDGYTSFAGTDATVAILFERGEPIILGECQTITYSIFAPMKPVYNLGKRKPSGYIRGPRTIAGSIIFTVFDRHVLLSAFHRAYQKYGGALCLEKEYLSDELPAFDLQVTFLNEYGQSAGMTVHDVRITSEGQVVSVEDMITENTMQYLASDITLTQPDFVSEPQ